MAELYGKRPGGFEYVFGIEPVPPTLDGPRDSYQVTIVENGAPRLDKILCLSEEVLSHYYIFKIARGFQQAKDLINLQVPFSAAPIPCDARVPPELHEHTCIRLGAVWLELVLWGYTLRNRIVYPDCLFASILCCEDQRDECSAILDGRFTFMICNVEQAVEFGRTLEEEALEARRLRYELGIPAINDD
jgi:hypothetical protein